jgi:hypothetical protein
MSLLGHADRAKGDLDGINLFGSESPEREKYIVYFKPAKVMDQFEAEVYDVNYALNGGLNDIAYRSKFRELSALREIQCNKKISFSSQFPDANFYLSNGLSGFENFGRWSDEKLVEIKVKLPEAGCNLSNVSFNLRGFITGNNPAQSSTVFFNGSEIGKANIRVGEKNPRDFLFGIPPELIKSNEVNILEFYVDNPVTPKSVGVNNDTRLLGFGFQSMVFH